MIRVEQLTKRFGRFTAVNGLSFEVKRGEAVALWGPNGAGKTTVIRCILGLLRCEGMIRIADFDARRQGKSARRCIGYVPQELAFYDDLRAADALDLFAALKRASRGRVSEVLEEVDLSAHAAKRVRELSGGMKQRLALAAALLSDPAILILDELTSNLDASAQSGFMTLLQSLKARGKTILFTSHHFEEVRALADRVLVLRAGQLQQDCRPEVCEAAPKSQLMMRVILDEREIERAASTLVSRGYAARRNGSGVFVPVEPQEKGAPIHCLMQSAIVVRDFDLIDCGRNGDSHRSVTHE